MYGKTSSAEEVRAVDKRGRELDASRAIRLAIAKNKKIEREADRQRLINANRLRDVLALKSEQSAFVPHGKTIVPYYEKGEVAVKLQPLAIAKSSGRGSKMYNAAQQAIDNVKTQERLDRIGEEGTHGGIGKYYKKKKATNKKPYKYNRYAKARKKRYHDALRKAYADMLAAAMDQDPVDQIIAKFEKKRPSTLAGVSPPRSFIKLEELLGM